jgi:hypothetical protein
VHEGKTDDPALPAQADDAVTAQQVRVARLAREVPQHRREPGSWRELPAWRTFCCDRALFAPMAEAELADEGWS